MICCRRVQTISVFPWCSQRTKDTKSQPRPKRNHRQCCKEARADASNSQDRNPQGLLGIRPPPSIFHRRHPNHNDMLHNNPPVCIPLLASRHRNLTSLAQITRRGVCATSLCRVFVPTMHFKQQRSSPHPPTESSSASQHRHRRAPAPRRRTTTHSRHHRRPVKKRCPHRPPAGRPPGQ